MTEPDLPDAPDAPFVPGKCFACRGEGQRTLYQTSQGWLVCLSDEYTSRFRKDVQKKVEDCPYCKGTGRDQIPCGRCGGRGELVFVLDSALPEGRLEIRSPYEELLADDVALLRQPCEICRGQGRRSGQELFDPEQNPFPEPAPETLNVFDLDNIQPQKLSTAEVQELGTHCFTDLGIVEEDGTINPHYFGFVSNVSDCFEDCSRQEQDAIRKKLKDLARSICQQLNTSRLPESDADYIVALSAPFHLSGDDDDGDREKDPVLEPEGGALT